MLILAVCFSLSRGALSADTPVAKVPHVSIPVRLDGRVNEAEWDDAAIISGGALGNPGTAVYLKYDQESLWVGVRCFEIEAGYPKAYVRQPTDLLENDDSVQVVLGITDDASGERGAINFGGCAGATDQAVAAADYYYQFTVNSAGATSRFFIESPLDRPLFEAKSAVLTGEWGVEMNIPFASWGVANPVGRSFPMNVFRFRPPTMMAWYLPGFGGYTPMPFGTMTFLPEDQSADKTVEGGAAALAAGGNTVHVGNATRVLAATLEWYPLSRKLIGQIMLPSDKIAAFAVICVNGEERLRQELAGDGPVKMRLLGVAPASVSKFSVIFPVKPEYARFFMRGQLQDTQELSGFGWEGRGGPPLWLGNQDKGLYFSCDTPLFLSNKARTQMQIIEEEGRTCLRLNLVNAPGQIPDANHIFRFFLQPTPTKKLSLAKSGINSGNVSLWFEDWSDYQGYPDLKKMPEVAKKAAAAHQKGQPLILYFNQMLAENAPGFQQFKADFLVPPGLMWYRRSLSVAGNQCPRLCYGSTG